MRVSICPPQKLLTHRSHLDDRHNTITAPAPPRSRPRTLTTGTWRAPNSQTSVVVTITNHIAGAAVLELLDEACTTIITHIMIHGDGLIVDGRFSWSGPAGIVVRTANANNHQQMWGVLGAALNAVAQYMRNSRVGAGAAFFSIFDGNNLVGTGSIG